MVWVRGFLEGGRSVVARRCGRIPHWKETVRLLVLIETVTTEYTVLLDNSPDYYADDVFQLSVVGGIRLGIVNVQNPIQGRRSDCTPASHSRRVRIALSLKNRNSWRSPSFFLPYGPRYRHRVHRTDGRAGRRVESLALRKGPAKSRRVAAALERSEFSSLGCRVARAGLVFGGVGRSVIGRSNSFLGLLTRNLRSKPSSRRDR